MGDIRNKKTGRILNGRLSYGYYRVALHKNRKQLNKSIHRLVAEAFIPNPNNLGTVDHINENKLDNRVENLQWLSNVDNKNKSWKGKKSKKLSNTIKKKWVENPYYKCKGVYGIKDGIRIEFKTTKDAEEFIGKKGIWAALNGKCKKIGGYEWKYKNGN